MQFKIVITLALVSTCFGIFAQNKYEREFRIGKEQFPLVAYSLLEEHLSKAKRIKFYKEIDSTKISFEAKFKKEGTWYSIEFNAAGALEDIEILLGHDEIPENTYSNIMQYLNRSFDGHRIKRIQRQYPVPSFGSMEATIENALENRMSPYINYELVIAGKRNKEYLDFEILFDAEGNFKNLRQSLTPNYDHVLY